MQQYSQFYGLDFRNSILYTIYVPENKKIQINLNI